MLLSTAELDSLAGLNTRSPHQFLGMHPLGAGKGVVVRAFIPGAAEVRALPTHDKSLPVIELGPIHEDGVFEGSSQAVSEVYAYDLEVTWPDGARWQQRDAYSFLPTLGEVDLFLFGQGNDLRLYEKFGAHQRVIDGVSGASFAVWAPNARRVSVVGTFNGWDGRRHMLRHLGPSGVWEIFIPGVQPGALYKFEVLDANGVLRMKSDPFAFQCELPPKTASIFIGDQKFDWQDQSWLEARSRRSALNSPMSIYEVHLGSWRKKSSFESPGYREIAGPLVDYVKSMGFTHVEFLPLAEHAYYPSWGYQVTGFFAPTCRYGTPDDFKFLVNALHQAGIGVIVDWVPAHFPRDDFALARFDGTALYEHEDPRQGSHQDWGTLIFNFGRHEVRNFLVANALYWCEEFHIDGLRVDAVASMLYLDYSRKEGEWVPNQYGGRENLDAVEFLKNFNHQVQVQHPGVMTIAEESTAWPQVSRPPYLGGLGFTLKWNMGWMHDTLSYFKKEPVYRKYHQHELTFAMLYHYHENFILPISHDEVVHGKGSLLGRMPGDDWQRFANMRTLLAYQWFFPGKKLLFMGCELGQSAEWNANAEVDWWLLSAGPYHLGAQKLVADLNEAYRKRPAFWDADHDPAGFYWIDCSDTDNSILVFARQSRDFSAVAVVILNLTPVPRENYRVGLPQTGKWREVLNTDALAYGGSNCGNGGVVEAIPGPWHNQHNHAIVTLPPMGVVVFEPLPRQ